MIQNELDEKVMGFIHMITDLLQNKNGVTMADIESYKNEKLSEPLKEIDVFGSIKRSLSLVELD